MKKILLFIFLLFFDRVYAINNITIDNNELSPKFEKNIKVYNYYTNKDSIKIQIDNKRKELKLENENNKYIFDGYVVNIFKNYDKNNSNEVFLNALSISGYIIDFNKDVFEYYIDIKNENNLDINYELSNDNAYVSISGNGNFNKRDNIISINVDNKSNYVIHAIKKVDNLITKKESKERPIIKKEIVKFIIVTISCAIIFLFAYLMFNKNSFYI